MTEEEIELEAAAQQADLATIAWASIMGLVEDLCVQAADFNVITTPEIKPTGHVQTDIAEMFREIHRVAGLVVDRLDEPPVRN